MKTENGLSSSLGGVTNELTLAELHSYGYYGAVNWVAHNIGVGSERSKDK